MRSHRLLASLAMLGLFIVNGLTLAVEQLPQAVPTFDMSLNSLPPNYLGSDFKAVYRSLLIPPKGEFETATEYESRKNSLPRGIYAFALPRVMASYLPEVEQFKVRIYRHNYITREKDISNEIVSNALAIIMENEADSNYVGSNAYGVKTVVRKSHEKVWNIIPTGKFLCWETNVGVPRDVAMNIKNRITAILIVAVEPESIPKVMNGMRGWGKDIEEATGKRYFAPTLSSPTESFVYFYSMEAAVEGIWIYDSETGSVLKKVKSLDQNCDIDFDAIRSN